ncbi:unnamed protein product, partial [Ectocarpus fasciculatus]
LRATSDEDGRGYTRTCVDLRKPRRHVWWSDMIEGGSLELLSESLPAETGLLLETEESPFSRTGMQSSIYEDRPLEEPSRPVELVQGKVLDSSPPDSDILCAIGTRSEASTVLTEDMVRNGNNLEGGGGRWRLSSPTPVESHLPQRKRSKFPVFEQLTDSGEVTGRRPMPQDDAACKKRKDSLNGEKDGSFVALFNELRGTKEEGSTRRRTFGPLSGHPRRPAESTMPRRRPSLFAVGHEAGGGCETSGLGGPHLGGEKLTSKVVDAQE